MAERELTVKQAAFLEALFGAANGVVAKAGQIAGYSPKSVYKIAKNLQDEIIDRAKYFVALHAPKAAMRMVDSLDSDGKTPNASIRLKASQEILDRVGIVKEDSIANAIEGLNTVFVLPAKR